MKGIYLDPEASVIGEQYALIKSGRRRRDRVPEAAVQIMPDRDAALAAARPAQQLYPAKVIGPSRSSEGLRLYYIVAWLDEET